MSVITSVAVTLYQISANDDVVVARAIRKVSAEYGFIADKGYTITDLNLDKLSQAYSQLGTAHWVVEQNDKVMDGDGVVPLGYSEPGICKL